MKYLMDILAAVITTSLVAGPTTLSAQEQRQRTVGTEDVGIRLTFFPTLDRSAGDDRIVLMAEEEVDLGDIAELEDRRRYERAGSILGSATFEAVEGDIVSILGASGAGRSTLLVMLGGLDAGSSTPIARASDVPPDAMARVTLTPVSEGANDLLDRILTRDAERLTLAARCEILLMSDDDSDDDGERRRRIIEGIEAGIEAEIMLRLRRR